MREWKGKRNPLRKNERRERERLVLTPMNPSAEEYLPLFLKLTFSIFFPLSFFFLYLVLSLGELKKSCNEQFFSLTGNLCIKVLYCGTRGRWRIWWRRKERGRTKSFFSKTQKRVNIEEEAQISFTFCSLCQLDVERWRRRMSNLENLFHYPKFLEWKIHQREKEIEGKKGNRNETREEKKTGAMKYVQRKEGERERVSGPPNKWMMVLVPGYKWLSLFFPFPFVVLLDFRNRPQNTFPFSLLPTLWYRYWTFEGKGQKSCVCVCSNYQVFNICIKNISRTRKMVSRLAFVNK